MSREKALNPLRWGDGDSEEGNMNMQIACLGQGKHFMIVEIAVFPGFFLQCDYGEFKLHVSVAILFHGLGETPLP